MRKLNQDEINLIQGGSIVTAVAVGALTNAAATWYVMANKGQAVALPETDIPFLHSISSLAIVLDVNPLVMGVIGASVGATAYLAGRLI